MIGAASLVTAAAVSVSGLIAFVGLVVPHVIRLLVSHSYRVIVPHDCVGDQELDAHESNLRDVGRRYADVMDLQSVLAHLQAELPIAAQ